MPTPAAMDVGEFVQAWNELGPAELSRRYGLALSGVFRRRQVLEKKGYQFKLGDNQVNRVAHPWKTDLIVKDGIVLIASDAHYWPGPPSLMHKALIRFCKELKPKAVIFNGDVIDAVTVSRHPPIGWEDRPKLADEIEAAKDRLAEIEKVAFKAQKVWTLGNHDSRFETRLATIAPEYAKIHGVHLKDHFPLWQPCWATWINSDIVVKHRFKGGVHATYNNTVYAGKTMITGHLHSAKVVPFTDYNGTRYGVDGGCIAETDAKAFVDYTEANPLNWRSAFCVLTFRDGLLMQPELVLKWDAKRVQFRGEVITP